MPKREQSESRHGSHHEHAVQVQVSNLTTLQAKRLAVEFRKVKNRVAPKARFMAVVGLFSDILKQITRWAKSVISRPRSRRRR